MRHRNWFVTGSIILAGLLISVTLVLTIKVLVDQGNFKRELSSRTDVRLCNEIEKIKTNIRDSITKSDKNLKQYRSLHLTPAEIELAHQQARDELKTFAPVNCTKLPNAK